MSNFSNAFQEYKTLPKKMVSHPCLFVFAVFGLRSTIAGVYVLHSPIYSPNPNLKNYLHVNGLSLHYEFLTVCLLCLIF